MFRLILGCILWASGAVGYTLPDACTIFSHTQTGCNPIVPASFLPASIQSAPKTKARSGHTDENSIFADLVEALNVTQAEFFAPWLGAWPEAIDWTAAVIGTHVSGVARSISEDLVFLDSKERNAVDWRDASNLIDKYFTQLVAYYFGQDAFAIRNEAYDDILWVVLGWLETIKLVNTHNNLYYTHAAEDETGTTPPVKDGIYGSSPGIMNQLYHGTTWLSTFSHRARVFWDLASPGWDTTLCNGGMIWNPHLLPYKNAITNELFIAASVSMYLYFPGDDNESPFWTQYPDNFNPTDPAANISSGSHDARYLKAAVEGYKWLRNSNMTNAHGLFVDGFHITGYGEENNNNTRCDARDEMVYTYNQGVILTGQRGLWDATGAPSFLVDGHRLIQSVIRATGYDLATHSPVEEEDVWSKLKGGALPRWHGLGRLGIMEEACDASATCSQDGQTFKGIFFHHFTTFCAPLSSSSPVVEDLGMRVVNSGAFEEISRSHAKACKAYGSWLRHNVNAALATRDSAGRFGGWWTAGLLKGSLWTEDPAEWPTRADDGIPEVVNATDYRNYGVPDNEVWRAGASSLGTTTKGTFAAKATLGSSHRYASIQGESREQIPLGGDAEQVRLRNRGLDMNQGEEQQRKRKRKRKRAKDPNDGGRGRTIETQSGGLGLLRAYWSIARIP
ncbi:glycosyl hydrolase family 76-domain-containing protein [Xylaria arbuscula]|nr:glycosyl hydrolase family 76-domain-containing protein [Xylaria arbuscula]